MTLTLRPITPAEFPSFNATAALAFAGPVHEDERDLEQAIFEFDRSIGAYDGDLLVGTAGAFSLVLSAPGGDLPAAGVTWVSVAPTHRRQGVLTQVMQRQLHDIHDRGAEALAVLWASEGAIYGRFGYGLASLSASIALPSARSAFVPGEPDLGRLVVVTPTEALDRVREVYELARSDRPGGVRRGDAWWAKRLADLPHWRGDGSPLRVVLHEVNGSCDGYAIYRTRPTWREGVPGGYAEVRELIHLTPGAARALWRFLLDLDLLDSVTADVQPLDGPLLHLLADPRAARPRVGDNLWLRLVDLPAALRQRSYGGPGRLVLEVADELCEWNSGRWELTVGGDGGVTCEGTRSEPDLRLGVAEVGAVYLGGSDLRALAAAGRVHELTPGAIDHADRMFAWSPLPCCLEVF